MKYGRAIRIIRAAKGLSQKDVATRAGLNPSYVSLLEKDVRTPSIEAVADLSNALEVPPHLFALLASEDHELSGIGEEAAGALGRELLNLLIAARATS